MMNKLELAPASALPTELRQLPQEVQEAYRFALANPDVLEVMPCYCGCNQAGHENNQTYSKYGPPTDTEMP